MLYKFYVNKLLLFFGFKGYLTNSTGCCFNNVVATVSTNEVISYDLFLAK